MHLHGFVFFSYNYQLSICYVLGTFLSIGIIAENKTCKVPILREVTS